MTTEPNTDAGYAEAYLRLRRKARRRLREQNAELRAAAVEALAIVDADMVTESHDPRFTRLRNAMRGDR